MKKDRIEIVIGCSPKTDRRTVTLNHEIAMVKAALLYADRVTLLSFTSTMLLGLFALADHVKSNVGTKRKLKYLIEFVDQIVDRDSIENLIALYEMTKNAKPRDKEAYGLKKKLEKTINDAWRELHVHLENMLQETNGHELLEAMAHGLLEVQLLGAEDENTGGSTDEMMWSYVDALADALNSSNSYPLLDDTSGALIEKMISSGHLYTSPHGVSRSKEASLSASLFERLPVMTHTSVADIISIRQEISPHLLRFRSAVMEYSESIVYASWEEEFAEEASRIFRREVAPAIADIEDAIKSNSYIAAMVNQLTGKFHGLGGMVLSIGVANAMGFAEAAALSFGGVGLLGNAAIAHHEWVKNNRDIAGHKLFYYYRAESELRTRFPKH